MKLEEAVKTVGLENEMFKYSSYGDVTYRFKYNYNELLSKWDEIYELLTRKTIKKLDDYNDIDLFFSHRNSILKHTTKKQYARSYSCEYSYVGKEVMDKFVSNLWVKMLSIENLSKTKNPIIFLKERNTWERETWEFGIPLDETNINSILKLKFYLDELYKDDNPKRFSIIKGIKNAREQGWNYYGSYMSSPIELEKVSNKKIEKLLNMDKETLEDALYKGQYFTKAKRRDGL